MALDQPDDGFGNPGDFEATYSSDADVTLTVAGDHYLYLADGTRVQATVCTRVSVAGRAMMAR